MIAKSDNISDNGGTFMKALEISNYLINLASQSNENDLTNLKLQKLLYFAQGKYMAANNGKSLFEEDVEAWGYGPVVNNVYHAFKGSGSSPITVFDDGYTPSKLPDDVTAFLNEIWNNIGLKYSAFYLVKATHAIGTPWQTVYEENVNNIVIPRDSLKSYFVSHEL